MISWNKMKPMIYLSMIGFISNMLWQIFWLVYEYYEKKYIASITVHDSDPVYDWVLTYLTDKGILPQNSMADSEVKTVEKKSNWWDAPSAKEKHKVEYKPTSSSFNLFTYKG